MANIRVKWQKEEYSLCVDLAQPTLLLKTQLLSLTGVLPGKQKLMFKGKVLQDANALGTAGVVGGAVLMLMGSASVLAEPEGLQKFSEDFTVQERAQLFQDCEGAALPAGLKNMGNTCYMNSTVQCLRRLKEFAVALTSFASESHNDPHDKFVVELGNVFRQLESSGDTVTPWNFIFLLRRMNPLFDETDEEGRHIQHDSEECFTFIMSLLEPKLRVTTALGHSASAVQELFGIEFESTVLCQEVEEPPTVLAEVSNKLTCIIDNEGHPVNQLSEGIEAGLFNRFEKHSPLLERDAVYTKQQCINKLPCYLVVHMVRFIWKQASSAAGTKAVRAKILRSVAFPKVLDVYAHCSGALQGALDVGRTMETEMRERELEEHKGRPAECTSVDAEFGTGVDNGMYQLVSVVTHKGRSADSGHYVGWAHFKDDCWVKYDDDLVTQMGTEEILNLKGGGDWHMAYILIYRKLQVVPEN